MTIENISIHLALDSIYGSMPTVFTGGFMGKLVTYGQMNPLALVVVSLALIIFYRYYSVFPTRLENSYVVEENGSVRRDWVEQNEKPWYVGVSEQEYEDLVIKEIPGSGMFPPRNERVVTETQKTGVISSPSLKTRRESENDSSDSDRSLSPHRSHLKVE